MIEPGYGCIRVSAVPGAHRSKTWPRSSEDLYKQDPNLKGLVLDLRNDPGGLLHGAIGGLAPPSCRRTRWSSRPTASCRDAPSSFYGRARILLRGRGDDPLRQAAGGGQDGADGGAGQRRLGLGLARSSPARCRTTSAPSSWARRPSARARCRPSCRSATTPRSSSPRRATTRRTAARSRRNGIMPDVLVEDPRRRPDRTARARGRPRAPPREQPRRAEEATSRQGKRPRVAEAAQPCRGPRRRSTSPPNSAARTTSSCAGDRLPEGRAGEEPGADGCAEPAAPAAETYELNDQQLLRYSRHILLHEIGIEGQERLRAAWCWSSAPAAWVPRLAVPGRRAASAD